MTTADFDNYLNSGFPIAAFNAWGIEETHPAIMRYEAYKHWARLAYPVRGTRPAEVVDKLLRLSGPATMAKRCLTDELRVQYTQRQFQRTAGRPDLMQPVLVPKGRKPRPKGTKPPTERVPLPRRPTWYEQVMTDVQALQDLGHPAPRSSAPTQVRGFGKDRKRIPLERARHSASSCGGCARCLPVGHTFHYSQLTDWRPSFYVPSSIDIAP